VYLTGRTEIGPGNVFHAHCVIGDAPQDIKYKGEATGLRIGANNIFREGATVHRSAKVGEETVIGSNNFIMVHSHIAHNVRLGDNVILANGALVAGHVVVEDRVFISGNCLVHQFVRIGTLAIMQGGSAISQDLPPYTVARGGNSICGLNTIGLKRAGIGDAERLELRRLFQKLFLSGMNLSQAVTEGRKEFKLPAAVRLLDFIEGAKRGICRHRGLAYGESEPDDAALD
jgi:UDP-N-acetylglucosamine acyltransferase